MAKLRLPMGEVMDTDWTNAESVIALAKRFGPGMTVIKHVDRTNYNITHTERRDRWDVPGVAVVYHT